MTHDEMERLTAEHDTKAAKIRALNEAGVATSVISDFLGIRYQHTYNVLLRAGRIGEKAQADVSVTPVLTLQVSPDGSVTLPESMLDQLDLTGGGELFCRQTPDGLLLMPREQAAAQLQKLAAQLMPEHANLLSALLRTGDAVPPPNL
ncbi:hypothetical protein [Sphingomonas adhaesiva]|uniref:hypothetical protein n=1 Tax=Sphingomonas adhaesiva TaxID=28212 RepID=UPI002FF5B2F2